MSIKRISVPEPEFINKNYRWCNDDKHTENWLIKYPKDIPPINPMPVYDHHMGREFFYEKRKQCIMCFQIRQKNSKSSKKSSINNIEQLNNEIDDSDVSSIVPPLYINTTFQIKKESDTNIKISEIQNIINELQNTIEQLIKNKNNLENKILQIDDGDDDNEEIKNLNHEIMICDGKITISNNKILLMEMEIKKLIKLK